MTKTQIKAELRRSAMEDGDPFYGVSREAFHVARFYRGDEDSMSLMGFTELRIFFLLIAEAL